MISDLSPIGTTHKGVKLRRFTLRDWATLAQLMPQGDKDNWGTVFDWAVGPEGLFHTIPLLIHEGAFDIDAPIYLEDLAGWREALGACVQFPKANPGKENNPGESTGSERLQTSSTSSNGAR